MAEMERIPPLSLSHRTPSFPAFWHTGLFGVTISEFIRRSRTALMVGMRFFSFVLVLMSVSFSGCLALSFGGKEITTAPCDCTDEARVASLESRVQAIEQRLNPNPPTQSPISEPQPQ
jgi:hypothetical protein